MFFYVVISIFALLSLLAYHVFVEIWLPRFWRSKIGRRCKDRLSKALRRLFFNMKDDVIAHLVTLCEPDGDEPFEPYMDSPLRTCPPCQFVTSPPNEGVVEEPFSNPPIARRGGRARGIALRRGGPAGQPRLVIRIIEN